MRKINPDEILIVRDDDFDFDSSSSSVYGSFGSFLFNLRKLKFVFGFFIISLGISYAVIREDLLKDFGEDFDDGIEEVSYSYMALMYFIPNLFMYYIIFSNLIEILPHVDLTFAFVFYILFVMGIIHRVFYRGNIKYGRIFIFNYDEIIELNQTMDGYEVTEKSEISDILVEKDSIEVKTKKENYNFDAKFLEDLQNQLYNI